MQMLINLIFLFQKGFNVFFALIRAIFDAFATLMKHTSQSKYHIFYFILALKIINKLKNYQICFFKPTKSENSLFPKSCFNAFLNPFSAGLQLHLYLSCVFVRAFRTILGALLGLGMLI